MSDWMNEIKELVSDPFYRELNDDGLTAEEEILSVIDKYGWHPISEPPPDKGWYLVTYDCSCYDGNGIDTSMNEYNPLSFSGDHWGMCGVIAWMPLPEPYDQKNCIERVDK